MPCGYRLVKQVRLDDECSLGVSQNSDCYFAANGGEVGEEDVKGIPCLKALKEDSHGHAGAGKNGRAAQVSGSLTRLMDAG